MSEIRTWNLPRHAATLGGLLGRTRAAKVAPGTDEIRPRTCVRVPHINQAKHDVRIHNLDVALVENVQSHELASEAGADELAPQAQLDGPVGSNTVDLGERVLQRRQDLWIPTRRADKQHAGRLQLQR